MTPQRHPTPAGLPVRVIPVTKRPTWSRVIAAVAGSISGLTALVWFLASMFSARPTSADVEHIVTAHASRPHVETDARLRLCEERIAAQGARIDWIAETLGRMADRQGVPTRPVPPAVGP